MRAGEGRLPSGDEVAVAVEVLRLLADATRLKVMWSLLDGEASVNALAETVGAAPASVSQHLAKLRLSGLVAPRREGARIFYRVDSDHVRQLVRDAVHYAEHTGAGTPRHHATMDDTAGTGRTTGTVAGTAGVVTPLRPDGTSDER